MFSDEEIKESPESNLMRPGDEIISIREVCLSDKFDKKELGFQEPLLSNSVRNCLDTRSLFRDSFFPDGLDQQQARFAWTEEDGNIASLVSEPGFGTTGQTTFGKDLDAAFKSELKEADTSSSVYQTSKRYNVVFATKPNDQVSSTSSAGVPGSERRTGQGTCKVDKADPRSRFHYVKYVKRHGRTVKLWECGICGREFQHQYTLMRHLPTHTDERNYHCDACGKSFRQLSTLSQHRAIHSAERPYACEVCNKTFNRVSTLISHRKTHSDQKPYKCHMCPKGFHQKGNLRNHLFTHTNERPYRCNICFKGFNQQSNLVCHKNKAHNEGACENILPSKIPLRLTRAPTDVKFEVNKREPDQPEVSSSVGPYLPSIDVSSSSNWSKSSWESENPFQESLGLWSNVNLLHTNGVIVDPINTFHMGVALAMKQTPFALLKPENGAPVLVKVVDTKHQNGKQMLVPATAEDLRTGGKIVLKSDEDDPEQDVDVEANPQVTGAVQIRVPVVATVVPKIQAGGRLHLKVEEPHHSYLTSLSSDATEVQPCSSKSLCPSPPPLVRGEPRLQAASSSYDGQNFRPIRLSSCTLPPPSPPLDLISLDLFEPMECIPLGPQITPVDSIERPPSSHESDIFIGKFEMLEPVAIDGTIDNKKDEDGQVPAAAEDLRIGKGALRKQDNPNQGTIDVEVNLEVTEAGQIGANASKIQVGSKLHTQVERLHRYNRSILAPNATQVQPCSSKFLCPSPPPLVRGQSRLPTASSSYDRQNLRPVRLSSCALPPPAPSPPLDFISLDLFEPMECIPLGPQTTRVVNNDQSPSSDDSDIFIRTFEDSIPLSD